MPKRMSPFAINYKLMSAGVVLFMLCFLSLSKILVVNCVVQIRGIQCGKNKNFLFEVWHSIRQLGAKSLIIYLQSQTKACALFHLRPIA